MPTHASPARRAPRAIGRTLRILPAAVLVAGGASFWVGAATPAADRTPVIVFGVLVTVAAAITALLWARRTHTALQFQEQAAESQDQISALETQIRERAAQAEQLADQTVPALVALLREGTSPEAALAKIAPTDDDSRQRILRALAAEIGRGERMRAAAMSACANAAGRVQALATSMLADLREMEDRHDEEVFGDLLKLDHSTAQAGRLADSIAVLTGARSGRRWTKPIVMESILRGAVGRISAYQRVRLHSTSTVAVAGFAAEGVMHALAELMDNATSFSPPAEEVHVYVEEVQAGVVVTIEDGGLVMGPAALRRAEAAVSAEPLDLTALSGTRLGLAVVGVLARKHGLTVSFRPSSRGGTGVVVMVPRRLITQPRSNAIRPARQDDAAAADTDPQAAALGASAPVNGLGTATRAARTETPGLRAAPPDHVLARPGLPKRQRGQTMANAASRPATAPAAKPARAQPDSGSRFGAFRQATRGKHTGPSDITGPGNSAGTASGQDDADPDAHETGGSPPPRNDHS
jgi:signal transduction histidine kinase